MLSDKELLLSEAAKELDRTEAAVYHMGARGELDMRKEERLNKWVVTKASVEKYKKAAARGA